MSVRIIAGKYKGFSLAVPPAARPTLSRYRQSLFDLLEAMANTPAGFFEGKIILDCFAGSGAFGLETLSRGASHAYFVDSAKESVSRIHSNVKKMKIENSSTIFCAEINYFGKQYRSEKYNVHSGVDLVFLDPPYGKAIISQALKYLLNSGWISLNTIIVTEEDAGKTESVDGYFEIASRTYGNTIFRLWRR
ncbi:MAG: RsmD family RNA methyltransferase [Holosporaceae bacterium]|jgi:16S rRNA (guanine966-N2)-methyltransferase|nr:RsmD family RNA methyltransferase [Holosporaceae bacterium]